MRTVIFIIAVFLIIRIVIRYIFPAFINKKFRDFEQQMRNQQNKHTKASRKENDVTLEFNRKNQKESKFKNEGEYVDFEEVE